jgi:molybdopterin-guanine dinucleotide biosynthesis protein A
VAERPVHALVLAGGQSVRMGRDKARLRRADGRAQLEHVVELVAPLVAKVWVSVRRDQPADALRDRYPQVVDSDATAGPLAGILGALDAEPGVDWLVLAIDLPMLDRETLEHLLAEASDPRFTAYASDFNGLPEPLCALYRAGSLAVIREFVDDDVRCPRKVLIRAEAELLELPNPRALDNMNTPEDLAAAGFGESVA